MHAFHKRDSPFIELLFDHAIVLQLIDSVYQLLSPAHTIYAVLEGRDFHDLGYEYLIYS